MQYLLSSSFLPKNIKIKIYSTIILPFALYGCETLCITLREECRLRVCENRGKNVDRVCENRVVGKIFGPKGREVAGGWRRLHNEELNDLYYLSNIRVIESRRMRWARHLTRLGEERYTRGFGVKTLGKDYLEDQGVDGRIILRWIFRKWDWEPWTGLSWLRIGTDGGNL